MKENSLFRCNYLVIFTLIVSCLSFMSKGMASSSCLEESKNEALWKDYEYLIYLQDFYEFNKLSSKVFNEFEQSITEKKINRLLSIFRKYFMSFSKYNQINAIFDKNRLKELDGKMIPLLSSDTCAHRSAFLVNIGELWGLDAIGQIVVERKVLIDGEFLSDRGHVAAVYRIDGKGWIVDPTMGFIDEIDKWDSPEIGVKKTFRFLPHGELTLWKTQGVSQNSFEFSRKELNHFLRNETHQLKPIKYNDVIVRETCLSMLIFQEVVVEILSYAISQGEELSDVDINDFHRYRAWFDLFVYDEPSEARLSAIEIAYKEQYNQIYTAFLRGLPNKRQVNMRRSD